MDRVTPVRRRIDQRCGRGSDGRDQGPGRAHRGPQARRRHARAARGGADAPRVPRRRRGVGGAGRVRSFARRGSGVRVRCAVGVGRDVCMRLARVGSDPRDANRRERGALHLGQHGTRREHGSGGVNARV